MIKCWIPHELLFPSTHLPEAASPRAFCGSYICLRPGDAFLAWSLQSFQPGAWQGGGKEALFTHVEGCWLSKDEIIPSLGAQTNVSDNAWHSIPVPKNSGAFAGECCNLRMKCWRHADSRKRRQGSELDSLNRGLKIKFQVVSKKKQVICSWGWMCVNAWLLLRWKVEIVVRTVSICLENLQLDKTALRENGFAKTQSICK